MISWPADLVEALIQRRAIILLGSGASATCSSPSGERTPGWTSLLKGLSGSLGGSDLDAFETAMQKSRLLDAAQIIVDKVSAPERETYLTREFANTRIRPGELYEYVNLLDQPIVMTTNYDRMYERYWEQIAGDPDDPRPQLYTASYDDGHVVDHLRSARQVLFKLHGDIGRVRDIVLSRSQYSRAKYEFSNYFKVVSALFLTRTVLFIGCGFNGDPDIDLLLEDSAFAAQSGWPHYAVIPEGKHASELSTIRSSFNVDCLQYENPDGSHANLLSSLRDLADLVVNGRS